MSQQDIKHAMLMERVGEGILAAAQAQERAIDQQLKALETMGKYVHGILACLNKKYAY